MNTNTKYWSLTWDTNVKQKKLPHEEALLNFFKREAEDCVFQYEKGALKQKEHIQGTFTLIGPRQSKTNVLKLFELTFKNISGLTLSPVYDKVAMKSYVTKSEGRVKGPFYGGKNEMYDKELAAAKLRPWQKELFTIMTGEDQEQLRDRKVILIQDSSGNTGKSWFQKWLRMGQKALVVRSLPVSSVERLISAVHILNKTLKVDLYVIDFTRTRGESQSYEDLFSAIEQIKNGQVIDVMYGKYNEAVFKPPMVAIFTNDKFENFQQYLSQDRWQPYCLNYQQELAQINSDGTYTPLDKLKKNNPSDETRINDYALASQTPDD